MLNNIKYQWMLSSTVTSNSLRVSGEGHSDEDHMEEEALLVLQPEAPQAAVVTGG